MGERNEVIDTVRGKMMFRGGGYVREDGPPDTVETNEGVVGSIVSRKCTLESSVNGFFGWN